MNDKNTIGKVFERGGGGAASAPAGSAIEAEAPNSTRPSAESFAPGAGSLVAEPRNPFFEVVDSIFGPAQAFGLSDKVAGSSKVVSVAARLTGPSDIRSLALKLVREKVQGLIGEKTGGLDAVMSITQSEDRTNVAGVLKAAAGINPSVERLLSFVAKSDMSVSKMVQGPAYSRPILERQLFTLRRLKYRAQYWENQGGKATVFFFRVSRDLQLAVEVCRVGANLVVVSIAEYMS